MTTAEILRISLDIARSSTHTWRDVYLVCLQAIRESGGACEKLFRKRLREIDWHEFSYSLMRKLGG